jgi:glycosyltransferase involved in cell wall biosynthesis
MTVSENSQRGAESVNNIGEMTYSVIVCAYTEARWDAMLAAVASLQAQTLSPSEIILVIDHNPALCERTQAYMVSAGVIVVENQGKRGLSGARNTGVALANGDIIAFIDEDAVAAPDWLAQLNRLYQNPDVMGVGGAIHPLWSGNRPKWFPEEFDWVVGCTYRGMPEAEKSVRNLIGCNMSFRRYVTSLNEGFRDGIGRIGTLPVGCEETEYCIRANERWPEKVLMYAPQAQVFHNVPKTRATWRYFCSRCYAEGVSKALIGQYVGTTRSLASEKAYVLKTLPKGVWRGFTSVVLKFDPVGLARAWAIVVGLSLTTFGYLSSRLAARRRQARHTVAPGGQVYS